MNKEWYIIEIEDTLINGAKDCRSVEYECGSEEILKVVTDLKNSIDPSKLESRKVTLNFRYGTIGSFKVSVQQKVWSQVPAFLELFK